MFTSTVQLVAVTITPVPSTASVHVAHSSVYVHPISTFTVEAPLSVTTGGVVSSIVTVLLTTFPVFPSLST
mgnify:CR=1 FL=1